MADELDIRELRFVAEYALCGVGVEAARRAGYRGKNASVALMKRADILAAIELEKNKIRESTGYNAECAMADLASAESFARENRSPMAVVKVVDARMRLNGLLVEKLEVSAGPTLIPVLEARKQRALAAVAGPLVIEQAFAAPAAVDVFAE
jgi:hypothetical protein